MPTYTFECDCGHREDRVLRMGEMTPAAHTLVGQCPACGGTLTRTFTPPQVNVFLEYATSDITGEPVRVSNKSQETELCRRHGVEQVSPTEGKQRRKKTGLSLPSLESDFQAALARTNEAGTEYLKEQMGRESKTGQPIGVPA